MAHIDVVSQVAEHTCGYIDMHACEDDAQPHLHACCGVSQMYIPVLCLGVRDVDSISAPSTYRGMYNWDTLPQHVYLVLWCIVVVMGSATSL